MIVYKTTSFYDFSDAFIEMRPDNFSYSGLRALFDYLEEQEEGIGETIEFDVIALCCEYSQYDSVEEVMLAYNLEDVEHLNEYTVVIECSDGSIIIQDW